MLGLREMQEGVKDEFRNRDISIATKNKKLLG